jgi:hypothetical protein
MQTKQYMLADQTFQNQTSQAFSNLQSQMLLVANFQRDAILQSSNQRDVLVQTNASTELVLDNTVTIIKRTTDLSGTIQGLIERVHGASSTISALMEDFKCILRL